MLINFEPFNDDDLSKEISATPFKHGEVVFKVTEAEATRAKSSGNPMIKMKLELKDAAGTKRVVHHHLVMTKSCAFFIKNFLNSIGSTESTHHILTTGSIECDNLLFKSGKCICEKGKEAQDKGYHYVDITSFLPKEVKTNPIENVINNKKDFVEDDIPF